MPQPTSDPTTALASLLPQIAVAMFESGPHDAAGRAPDERPPARRAPGERLTARQMRAVLCLAAGEPRTMGDVAAGLHISRAAATEMVERLVEKGVAVRDGDPADRRVVRVRLAPWARAYADRARDAWRARIAAALALHPGLDPDALVSFLHTLAAGTTAQTEEGAA